MFSGNVILMKENGGIRHRAKQPKIVFYGLFRIPNYERYGCFIDMYVIRSHRTWLLHSDI